jgi:hypothetical protein
MIWCRFESTHGPSYGLVEGDVVTEVNGPPWGDHEITAIKHPLESVKLLVPVVPNTFYAGGLNYERHADRDAAQSRTGGSLISTTQASLNLHRPAWQ